MHPLYRKAGQLSQVAIGSAIEVHRFKGPGLIERWNRSKRREQGFDHACMAILYHFRRKHP